MPCTSVFNICFLRPMHGVRISDVLLSPQQYHMPSVCCFRRCNIAKYAQQHVELSRSLLPFALDHCAAGISSTCALAVQGTVLDGHKLALQLSMRKARTGAGGGWDPKHEDSAEDRKGKGTKLVVRNVAFEATRKDLMALCTPFGQIRSCRLPKKMDGNHRSDSNLR